MTNIEYKDLLIHIINVVEGVAFDNNIKIGQLDTELQCIQVDSDFCNERIEELKDNNMELEELVSGLKPIVQDMEHEITVAVEWEKVRKNNGSY